VPLFAQRVSFKGLQDVLKGQQGILIGQQDVLKGLIVDEAQQDGVLLRTLTFLLKNLLKRLCIKAFQRSEGRQTTLT
jgi:hypothetical protein